MRLTLVVALVLALVGAVAISSSGLACMLEDLERAPSASIRSEPTAVPLPTAPEVDGLEMSPHAVITR
jgi:hypothetical protein